MSEKEVLGKTYHLSVCEDCLTKKHPEYQILNKGRVFNRLCDITNYAFDIPADVSSDWVSQNYAITLENLIIKHGKSDGEDRWKKYCDQQALTNTFEYKKEKYGWDKKKFDKYNNSRAVTIDNLIKRHGEEKGMEVWGGYIAKQKYSCSSDYFIKEYGEEKGKIIYENFIDKKSGFADYSLKSQDLFNTLVYKLKKDYKYYYATNENKEYTIYSDDKHYYLDFYIEELKLCIEFNGDLWHANPNKYKERDYIYSCYVTAGEIWERDRIRTEFLKTRMNDVIIVWERDFKKKGIDKITDELVEMIRTYEQ